MAPAGIVLASTSAYRAELLSRIVADFTSVSAAVDETALANEAPSATACRLAALKACAGAEQHPGCLVIGSDQVAELDGQAIGKPGSPECAFEQLSRCSGRIVHFHTAVCLADDRAGLRVLHDALHVTRVRFRRLSDTEISRYLKQDNPLDCAGSFKIEKLGIALFEQVESTDPTALIGLPLIDLCRLLRLAGLQIP